MQHELTTGQAFAARVLDTLSAPYEDGRREGRAALDADGRRRYDRFPRDEVRRAAMRAQRDPRFHDWLGSLDPVNGRALKRLELGQGVEQLAEHHGVAEDLYRAHVVASFGAVRGLIRQSVASRPARRSCGPRTRPRGRRSTRRRTAARAGGRSDDGSGPPPPEPHAALTPEGRR